MANSVTGPRIQRLPGGDQITIPVVPRPSQDVPLANSAAGNVGSDTRHFALDDHQHPAVVAFGTKTVNYTALATDQFLNIDATAGNVTISLPQAATVPGMWLVVKKIDAGGNTVFVDPFGAETIDGAATKNTAVQYVVFRVWCDGATWWTW